MPAHLQSRPDARGRAGLAELYSSVILLCIVIGISYVVFAQFPTPKSTSRLLVVTKQLVIFGNPSLLLIQINGSASLALREFRLDSASSLDGTLALGPTGFGTVQGLCTRGMTTFFSVLAPNPGSLLVETDGLAWVDGSVASSAAVGAGWHEIIIADASTCSVHLPGGTLALTSSGSASSIPTIARTNSTTIETYIPFATNGHSLTLVTDSGVVTIGF